MKNVFSSVERGSSAVGIRADGVGIQQERETQTEAPA